MFEVFEPASPEEIDQRKKDLVNANRATLREQGLTDKNIDELTKYNMDWANISANSTTDGKVIFVGDGNGEIIFVDNNIALGYDIGGPGFSGTVSVLNDYGAEKLIGWMANQ